MSFVREVLPDEESERSGAALQLLKTAGYFTALYFFNTANNIFNKKARPFSDQGL